MGKPCNRARAIGQTLLKLTVQFGDSEAQLAWCIWWGMKKQRLPLEAYELQRVTQ